MSAPTGGAASIVNVELADRSYQVIIGTNLLTALGTHVRQAVGAGGRAFLVLDSGIPGEVPEIAGASLGRSGFRVSNQTIVADEEHKSLSTLEQLLAAIAATRHERAEPIVSIGGGVIGDIAGFAAATYRRGVPFVQCPTTLLSMVDASVGGKTGVNLAVGAHGAGRSLKKNMVGAFHQPSLVVCDVSTLKSLAPQEYASGFAECIKHGLLGGDWGDPGLLDWTIQNAGALLRQDHAALTQLVQRNVAIKAAVVHEDEREQGADHRGRMCLNMGHTIGHVIETSPPPSGQPHQRPLRHGEAVGLGLLAEAACGEHAGVTRRGTTDRIRAALSAFGLPVHTDTSLNPGRIADAMLDDKKVAGGQLRLAVPTGDETCLILNNPPREAILAGISAIST
jgi:3-dehydroquinate synthase